MKLTKILKHYEKNIYNGKYEIVEVWKDIIYLTEKGDLFPKIIEKLSLNDLLSPESWFLQAVFWEDWSEMYNKDYYQDNVNAFESVYDNNNWIFSLPRRKYHAMKLSILSNEDRITYLENNILID